MDTLKKEKAEAFLENLPPLDYFQIELDYWEKTDRIDSLKTEGGYSDNFLQWIADNKI